MRGFEKVHKWWIKPSHCISFWDPSLPIRFKSAWTTTIQIKTKKIWSPSTFYLIFFSYFCQHICLASLWLILDTGWRANAQFPLDPMSSVLLLIHGLISLILLSLLPWITFSAPFSIFLAFLLENLCWPIPNLSMNVVPLLLVMTSYTYINHNTFHINIIQDMLYIFL